MSGFNGENKFREDFPIFSQDGDETIYFDNAATAQRPKQVTDAMARFNATCNANPLRGLYGWSVRATQCYEKARHTAAGFIGAKKDCEIVFTRNTTESLNLIAYSYALTHLKPGDEIVLTVMEHHSNILPWQMAAKKTGARLVYMEPEPDGTLTEEEIRKKITGRAAIVSVGHVSNVLGVTNPVKLIGETAHEHGAVFVVDGAQAVPHIPVDVNDIGADFYAFSGHKLTGPMGIGVLFGRSKLLEEMPPFLTGGEMIEYVTRESATFAPIPEKFEAGTVNAQGAVGLEAAINYVKSVGFDTIRKNEEALTAKIMDGLAAIPHVSLYGPADPSRHSGIITFNIDGCHPHDVASVLDTEHIAIRAGHHCAQPLMEWLQKTHGMEVRAACRASLYFYNTAGEAEKFIDAVGKVRNWLGY